MDDGIARMGQVVFSGPNLTELRALGLGSCIGLCVYDPGVKLGCVAHIVLPEAKLANTPDVGKYADTALPYVVKQMTAKGAQQSRMRVAIAGGAQLFSFEGSESRLDVGKRNTEAVKSLLSIMRLKLVAEEVGGRSGRTIVLDAATGEVMVKQAGGTARLLAKLTS
ncbi:MAG: chemotaxis protein CheD [Armatimonadetes bacterium]|nr:chemotaxis protein CheD [Armatimonadota bacterium]